MLSLDVYQMAIAFGMACPSMSEDATSHYMKRFFYPRDYHKVNLVWAGCAQGLHSQARLKCSVDLEKNNISMNGKEGQIRIKAYKQECFQKMIEIAAEYGFGEDAERYLYRYLPRCRR